MKKKLLVQALLGVLLSMLLAADANAQDAQFTQFYANPLYLNPAFAGSTRCPRFCLNFRDEWPTIEGTFVSYSASFDRYIDGLGGIGVLVEQDKAGGGVITTSNVSLIYSYQLKVSRTFAINAGFQGTYHQKNVDAADLNYGDMIDPVRGFVYTTEEQLVRTSVSTPDFSAGLLGYGRNVYFGVSIDHLTQPDESFISQGSDLPIKYTGHAGAMIPIGSANQFEEDKATISPNILYQRQGNFQQLDLGFYFMKSAFMGGLWYRNNDAVAVLVGFNTKTMKVGYSYDVTISKLAGLSGGAHEISVVIQYNCKKPKHRYRALNVPSF